MYRALMGARHAGCSNRLAAVIGWRRGVSPVLCESTRACHPSRATVCDSGEFHPLSHHARSTMMLKHSCIRGSGHGGTFLWCGMVSTLCDVPSLTNTVCCRAAGCSSCWLYVLDVRHLYFPETMWYHILAEGRGCLCAVATPRQEGVGAVWKPDSACCLIVTTRGVWDGLLCAHVAY